MSINFDVGINREDDVFVRQQYEHPKGEMEVKLANIWHSLLNIERISRNDNFFALGGDSLLIVKMLADLRNLELETSVQEIYDAPNLATLALKLKRYNALTIPSNLITKEAKKITPEMLPLITLSQTDIDSIVGKVLGGIANVQDIYGLTPFQSDVLFHHVMAKEGDPYLTVRRMRLTDRTSLENYADAVQKLTERHDILRTIFIWDGPKEPGQVVLRKVPLSLTEITPNESDKSVLNDVSQQFSPLRYRLDLTQAPLLRLLVTPESNGSWMALQLMHHSVIDHSTQEMMQAEIHSIMNGKIETLLTPTAFRNFVAQARFGASAAEHTRFFTEMLGDIDEPTLPFGLKDVDLEGTDVEEAYLQLSQELNDQLRLCARNLRVTLAGICHLAWAQILARASECKSVVFGTVLRGHLQAEGDNNSITGPMINTLPLRLNMDARSVEDAVRHAHTQLSALLAHAHAPLVLAQRCSGFSVDLPIFSALLNYHHQLNTGEVLLPHSRINVLDDMSRPNYALVMSVKVNSNSLGLRTQVISPHSAARICSYMQQALQSLADALAHTPQMPVQKLTAMPPEERTLLLHSWNQIKVNHTSVCCLHQLFEEQVNCDTAAIAVEFEGELLSYGALNSQANQLAHYLLSKGVQPHDHIAICVDRSTAMIVAMLATLKCGCAYVPLDPIYPSQRLNNILLDADPKFLLVDSLGHQALGAHPVPMIELSKSLLPNLTVDNPNISKLGLNPFISFSYIKNVLMNFEKSDNLSMFDHYAFWCSR